MSQTIDTPSYTIELSDGSIRPMTVKELAIRLEQLMSADKGIAEMVACFPLDVIAHGTVKEIVKQMNRANHQDDEEA